MARKTYIFRNGEFVEKKTGEAMVLRKGPIAAPMVMRDTPEYRSPVDGRLIGSRSERREDLKRNNCIEWDPALSPTRGKAEFKNARFAKKHNLPLSEKAQHG
jgi:hypothetical protein